MHPRGAARKLLQQTLAKEDIKSRLHLKAPCLLGFPPSLPAPLLFLHPKHLVSSVLMWSKVFPVCVVYSFAALCQLQLSGMLQG